MSSLLWDSPAERDRHGAPVKPPSTTNTHRRQGVFRGPCPAGGPAAGSRHGSRAVPAGRPAGARPRCRCRRLQPYSSRPGSWRAAGERRRTGKPLVRPPPGRPLELDDDQGVEAPAQHDVHVHEIDREDAAAPGRAGPASRSGRRARSRSRRHAGICPLALRLGGLRPARRSMNNGHLLYVLVDMQTVKRSKRVQPLDRRPRRVPSRGALAAILFGVVVLAAFGHITALLLFLLAGIAVLTAVLRRRRSGR